MSGIPLDYQSLLDLYEALGCPECSAPPPTDTPEEETEPTTDADGNLDPEICPPTPNPPCKCPCTMCELIYAVRGLDGYIPYKGTIDRTYQAMTVDTSAGPQMLLPGNPNRRSMTITSVSGSNFQMWWTGYGQPGVDPPFVPGDNKASISFGPPDNTSWLIEGVTVLSDAGLDTWGVYQEIYVEVPCTE